MALSRIQNAIRAVCVGEVLAAVGAAPIFYSTIVSTIGSDRLAMCHTMAGLGQGRLFRCAASARHDVITIYGAGCGHTLRLGHIVMGAGSIHLNGLATDFLLTVFHRALNYRIIGALNAAGGSGFVFDYCLGRSVGYFFGGLTLTRNLSTSYRTVDYRVVATLVGAGCSHFVLDDDFALGMPQSANDSLCNQNLTADIAVFTLGQTGCGAGGVNCFVNYFDMGRYRFVIYIGIFLSSARLITAAGLILINLFTGKCGIVFTACLVPDDFALIAV